MNIFPVLLSLFLITQSGQAAPVMGKSICIGQDCDFKDTPIGTYPDKPEKERKLEQLSQPALEKTVTHSRTQPQPLRRKKSRAYLKEPTNLPDYLQNIDRSEMVASSDAVYNPPERPQKLKGLKSGDLLHAVIEQEIKASQTVPTPIRALVTTGFFKGSYLQGEATLDRELKRVLLTFDRLHLRNKAHSYRLKASGLSLKGSVGLEGHYVTQTGKFFVYELASATAAGLVDSSIQRQQTTTGGYVQEPSLSNSAKSGAVSALSKTTERLAERVRTAPEYTELKGYKEIQVIIQENPIQLH